MGVGGTYSDNVAVYNYGTTALQLSVFAADLENGDNGDIAVGLQGAGFNDAGGWVKLAAKVIAVTLPPQTKNGPGRAILPFHIEVPNDAIPGDHGAAIVATLSTLGKNPQGENVKLDQRIATRIYLRVAGPLHASLSVENVKVKYHGTANPAGTGSAIVTYTVHNTGNVRLAATQQVSVTGLLGMKSKTAAPPNVELLFPRSSQTVTATVTGVLATVFERAQVTVTPLLFQDQTPTPTSPAHGTKSFYAVPWTLLGVIVLVIVLIVVGFFGWRRRNPPPTGGSRHHRNRRGPSGPPDADSSGPNTHRRTSQKVSS
jgi:hypothetical protein